MADERQADTPPAGRLATESDRPAVAADAVAKPSPVEVGGPKGPEPTRYGDWERKGRCIDF